jgi:hypothetical protein
MRILVMGILAIAAALAATVQPSSAQFNSRYCSQGGRGGTGEPDCSYRTMAQCRAAASGNGRYCAENPNWHPQGRDQRRRNRHQDNDYND